MHLPTKRSYSITHALTSHPQTPPPILQQPDIPVPEPKKRFNPYKVPKFNNPLTERSRKHRLLEERNLEIQKSNRMLFEKIRKIKMKSMYQSDRKIEAYDGEDYSIDKKLYQEEKQAKITLPHINDHRISTAAKSTSTISNKMLSMNSTKSYLHNILQDRTTFVEQYFTDLNIKKNNRTGEKQLGVFSTENGWKVKVILVDDQNILLIGKKGRNQLTKKYLYSKVKNKVENGLEEWVKHKFSFQL